MRPPTEQPFVYSRHGTMFLYPLQVHLYQALERIGVQAAEARLNLDALEEPLRRLGYGERAIRSEVERAFYMAVLIADDDPGCRTCRFTQFGQRLVERVFAEAGCQTGRALFRITRRGPDHYQLAVRDTSFLTPALRSVCEHFCLKARPVYELRKPRVSAVEVEAFFNAVLDKQTPAQQQPASPAADQAAQLIASIRAHGSYYPAIGDTYVHYAIPNDAAWNDREEFRTVTRAVLRLGRKPVEWRGASFTGEALNAAIDEKTAAPVEPEQQRSLLSSLVEQGFLRSLTSQTYTLTGQGATWLEPYFAWIDENYSVLDLAIWSPAPGLHSIRIAHATYLPDEISDLARARGAQPNGPWLWLRQMDRPAVVSWIGEAISRLTVWGKRARVPGQTDPRPADSP